MGLFGRRPALLISLPRNDPMLAEAAAGAGADGLKTHVNVAHRASGTSFGSVAAERSGLREILGLGLPTGLVVGGEGAVDRSEMAAAAGMGFAFFDVYLAHAPAWYVDACAGVPAVAALGTGDPPDRAGVLGGLGFAAVEASLTPPEEYGTPLPARRLADYARVVELSSLPVIVPSQHALTVDDVHALVAAGVAAVLLGAVVTGTEPARVAEVTGAFRTAIGTAASARERSAEAPAGQ